MDESFLSDAEVIKASRDFVCIRLATYEDAAEADFLRTIFVSREGDLENTVFCILSPDGEDNLCRPGRSPHFVFRSSRDMAREMKKLAAKYDAIPPKEGETRLPEMKDVRLTVNVSSCDGIPAIICYGKDKAECESLKKKLAPLALDSELAGKFVYGSTADFEELKDVKKVQAEEYGYLLVAPDQYGTSGEKKQQLAVDISANDLKKALGKIAGNESKVKKQHNRHVREGNRNGIEWKTEIPVEDRNSLRAMQRRGR